MSLNDLPSDLEGEFERYAVLRRITEKAHALMPAELVQAISAVKNAIDGVKILNSYVDEIKDATKRGELMRVIAELNIELANAKMQLAETIRLNTKQETQIEKLEAEIQNLKNPQKILTKGYKGLYYDENGEGPFCPNCYLSSKTANLLNVMQILYSCPVCRWKKS